MRSSARRPGLPLFEILVVLAMIAGLHGLHSGRQAEPRSRFGKYTRDEIGARATVQALRFPVPHPLYMTTSQECVHTRIGALKRFWSVEFSDEQGSVIAYQRWDADTGQILIFSRSGDSLQPRGEPLTERQAIAWAQHWLQWDGTTLPGEQWRLCALPQRTHSRWCLYFHSDHRSACLLVDGVTGMLECLRFQDRSLTP